MPLLHGSVTGTLKTVFGIPKWREVCLDWEEHRASECCLWDFFLPQRLTGARLLEDEAVCGTHSSQVSRNSQALIGSSEGGTIDSIWASESSGEESSQERLGLDFHPIGKAWELDLTCSEK